MIYFAHPINTYNKHIERHAIGLIEDEFQDIVLNPNNPKIELMYKKYGMEVFKKLVKKCSSLVCLPFDDFSIGAGKAKEIEWALQDNKPCYLITDISSSSSELKYEQIKSLSAYKVLTVDQTRKKLKNNL